MSPADIASKDIAELGELVTATVEANDDHLRFYTTIDETVVLMCEHCDEFADCGSGGSVCIDLVPKLVDFLRKHRGCLAEAK